MRLALRESKPNPHPGDLGEIKRGVVVMKLKQLAIKRQEDDSFAIVVSVQMKGGSVFTFILKSADAPKDLQKTFMLYSKDSETLQADVMYHMQQAI